MAPLPSPVEPLDLLLRRPPVRCAQDVQAIEAALPDPLTSASSTYELLVKGAQRDPDAPALSFFLEADQFQRPFVWSHRRWIDRITQTANLLRDLGLGRDDTVAYVLPNLPETHWVIWGGEAAGRVLALNPLLEPAMLRELMKAVQPRLLVTLSPTPGTDLWDKVASFAQDVASLRAILTVSPARYLRGAQAPAARSLARRKQPRSLGPLPVFDLHAKLRGVPSDKLTFDPPAQDDVASCFCTGGTTGMPKIAVRTHRTELANAIQVMAMFGQEGGAGQPLFCGLPLFHVNAQIATGLMPWARGGHVVLGTPQGWRTPEVVQAFWRIVEHYRLYSFSGVPTIYSALLQAPRGGAATNSLRYGLCGAAPMPFELLTRFERETGIRILEGYGLTEGGCVSTINPPGGAPRPGSIGIRLPWQELKILVLDADGRLLREAATGETGTIAIRGSNLFAGYLNPAHNRNLWIDVPPSRSPWLNTGDLGRIDEEGQVWLTGRSKELIIRGGHNIDPKMLEEPMHEHPSVALAAAVGRPDAHAGEVPVVYVQLRPGSSSTAQELQEWGRQRIAERAAWPRQVTVMPALPTTAVGKIFKPALVDMEMCSVVADEARSADAELLSCEVIRPPGQPPVVRWQAQRNADALAARLVQYTFRTERA